MAGSILVTQRYCPTSRPASRKSFFRRLSSAVLRLFLLTGAAYALSLLVFGFWPSGGSPAREKTLRQELAGYASLHGERSIPVFLVNNGVHVDLALPARQIVTTQAGRFSIDWEHIFLFTAAPETMRLMPSALAYPALPRKEDRYSPPSRVLAAVQPNRPLPRTQANRPLPGAAEAHNPLVQENNWAVIGWGHKEFYTTTPTWADLRPGVALRAAMGGESILHVDMYQGRIHESNEVRLLFLTEDEYIALHDYIQHSIRRDASGLPQLAPAPPTLPRARFIEGNGRFSVINTCNTWVAGALWAVNQPGPRWTTLPFFLMYHVPPQPQATNASG